MTMTSQTPTNATGFLSRVRRVGTLTAVAAAIGVGFTLAPVDPAPAHAYDRSHCSTAGLNNTDTIRKDAGKVDFGDILHITPLFQTNGAPYGDAIVCWYTGRGKVYLKGRLFNDKLNGDVRANIRVYRGTGSNPILAGEYTTPALRGNGIDVTNQLVERTFAPAGVNDLYRLRVSLQTKPWGSSTWTEQHVSNVHYGS